MTEREAFVVLRKTLQKCGVPGLAICEEKQLDLKLSDGTIFRPDLIVVAADGETPLAAFEFNVRGTKEDAYKHAQKELRPLALKGIKVFAVLANDNNELMFLKIGRFERPWGRWRPLEEFGKAFGNYALESLRIQERNSLNEVKLARFRHWVVFVGIVISTDVAVLEEAGFEFSWKFYTLVLFVFILYATSYGFSVKFSINGNEISICQREQENGHDKQ